MKVSEVAELVVKMAVAGKMVSKRSARAYMEDGDEHTKTDNQAKRVSKCEDVALVPTSEVMERKGSASSSKASSETSSVAAYSGRLKLDSWADPEEPLSWEGGKLLQRDFVEETQYLSGSLAEEAGLLKMLDYPSMTSTARPPNFGVVVPGVYRCGYPQPEDYTFMQSLGLKSVLTLVHKELPVDYKPFLTANGIRHHVFSMKGTKKENIPIKTMQAILRLVLDRRNHPLLIHCNHGKHRTGCVVGVVRKVTGWELPSILEEYKNFSHPKERECDINYITSFDLTVISDIFDRRSRLDLKARAFLRAALFTTAVLLIWLASGSVLTKAGQINRHLNFR